ncbi:MAG: Dihydrofolate reductase, partial [uncultured Thermomicrobiales bacterium]
GAPDPWRSRSARPRPRRDHQETHDEAVGPFDVRDPGRGVRGTGRLVHPFLGRRGDAVQARRALRERRAPPGARDVRGLRRGLAVDDRRARLRRPDEQPAQVRGLDDPGGGDLEQLPADPGERDRGGRGAQGTDRRGHPARRQRRPDALVAAPQPDRRVPVLAPPDRRGERTAPVQRRNRLDGPAARRHQGILLRRRRPYVPPGAAGV